MILGCYSFIFLFIYFFKGEGKISLDGGDEEDENGDIL
jgi:hypothetical protein